MQSDKLSKYRKYYIDEWATTIKHLRGNEDAGTQLLVESIKRIRKIKEL